MTTVFVRAREVGPPTFGYKNGSGGNMRKFERNVEAQFCLLDYEHVLGGRVTINKIRLLVYKAHQNFWSTDYEGVVRYARLRLKEEGEPS